MPAAAGEGRTVTHIHMMSSPTTATPSPFPYILALGDSLTAGHGLHQADAFPRRLELLLREHYPLAEVLGAGVSGDTAGAALARLPRVLASLEHRPDLAIVELGANDLLRGVMPARTRTSLNAIVHELARCGIPVLLATLEVPPFLASFGSAYANIYRDVAEANGIASHPFFPDGVLGRAGYVLTDRIHPNAKAIDLAARNMLPAVLRALAKDIRVAERLPRSESGATCWRKR